MAVPDNNSFSLSDVINEVTGTQTSLSECFAESNGGAFNSTYDGAKDRLSNFRDYNEGTGGGAYLTVSTSEISIGDGAGNISFYVSTNAGFTISDNAFWIGNTGASFTGSQTITLSNTENIGNQRTGTITVTGTGAASGITRQITVTQAEQAKYIDAFPSAIDTADTDATQFTIDIESNVYNYTISDSAGWLSTSKSTGSGFETFIVYLTAYTGSGKRQGTITLEGGGVLKLILIEQGKD